MRCQRSAPLSALGTGTPGGARGGVAGGLLVVALALALAGCISRGTDRDLPSGPNEPPDGSNRWFFYVTEANDPSLNPATNGGQLSVYEAASDGTLPSGPPIARFPLQNPRRVIKHPTLPVIYVATRTQVVAFDITDGTLRSLCPENNTPECLDAQENAGDEVPSPCILESPCATINWPGTSPVEMTIENGLLYVVEQGNNDNIAVPTRVMAYELFPDGGLPTYATSEGTDFAAFSYVGIGLVPGFAWVSDPGRQVLEGFPLEANGNFTLPASTPTPAVLPTPTVTPTPADGSTPTPTATPVVTLVGGHQPAKIVELEVPSPRPSPPCSNETTTLFVAFQSGSKLRMVTYPVDPITQQLPNDPTSQSNTRGVYFDMLLDPSGTHIYGSAFYNGQIDRFDVDQCGLIVRDTLQTTFSDTEQYPVGIDWWPAPIGGPNGAVVVAAAGLGRVDVYQLDASGSLPSLPTSSTDVRSGTFPNDVLVVGLP